jgi:hypothetical protein
MQRHCDWEETEAWNSQNLGFRLPPPSQAPQRESLDPDWRNNRIIDSLLPYKTWFPTRQTVSGVQHVDSLQ